MMDRLFLTFFPRPGMFVVSTGLLGAKAGLSTTLVTASPSLEQRLVGIFLGFSA